MLSQADNDFSSFTNISVTERIGDKSTELEEYLRKPVENVKEPLKWWIANRHVYPTLHRMALDYLSIPGELYYTFYSLTNLSFVATSTAVERVFSQGRQLLSFTRNRLQASSFRMFLCLGSWGRHDLVLFDDVLAAVRAGSKRKRDSDVIDVEAIA